MDTITRGLAALKPADLHPAWKYVDLAARSGEMDAAEAQRWKEGIFGLMVLWGLEPDDLVTTEERN